MVSNWQLVLTVLDVTEAPSGLLKEECYTRYKRDIDLDWIAAQHGKSNVS